MARKTGLDDLFKSGAGSGAGDEPKPNLNDLDEGVIKPVGVGLREGEIAALEAIGAELGELLGTEPITRNALTRIAVQRLIADYRAGRVDLAAQFEKPPKPKARIKK